MTDDERIERVKRDAAAAAIPASIARERWGYRVALVLAALALVLGTLGTIAFVKVGTLSVCTSNALKDRNGVAKVDADAHIDALQRLIQNNPLTAADRAKLQADLKNLKDDRTFRSSHPFGRC